MNRRWPRTVIAAAMLAGCLAFASWLVVRALARPRGLDPGKLTELELTCVNEQCPGRHTDPDTGEAVPYTVRKMLPAGFTDWPLECPECGQKSLYNVMTCPMCSQFRKRQVTWKVLDASDPSQYQCPECGFSPYE